MKGCFKYIWMTIVTYTLFLLLFGSFFYFANKKPDFLKNNFSNFVDSLQVRKSSAASQPRIIKDDATYSEPSAFEREQ